MSMGTTDKPTYRQKIRGWRALKRERQHGGGGGRVAQQRFLQQPKGGSNPRVY